MKKYRSGYQSYLYALVLFLILFPFSLLPKFEGVWYVFCVPLVIINSLCLINAIFFTYKSVDDTGIHFKSFLVNTLIEWDEISGVYDVHEIYSSNGFIINFLFKYMVSIHCKDKRRIITSWTRNSKELIKIVVEECKKRNVEIDPLVEKIIED